MGWNSTQNTCTENNILYKLTNSRGRNGLTTSFQVFTLWYGISCSFLMITHLYCALVCYYHQKAHSIPYHTVNTWNEVVNPSKCISILKSPAARDFNISLCFMNIHVSKYYKRKGKGSCLESRLHDNACSIDFTFPVVRWVPKQPATIDPTLDLCTQVPITAGWTKALWNTKFARHLYRWPALGIEPKTVWSWAQCYIHWAACSPTSEEGILMYQD